MGRGGRTALIVTFVLIAGLGAGAAGFGLARPTSGNRALSLPDPTRTLTVTATATVTATVTTTATVPASPVAREPEPTPVTISPAPQGQVEIVRFENDFPISDQCAQVNLLLGNRSNTAVNTVQIRFIGVDAHDHDIDVGWRKVDAGLPAFEQRWYTIEV